MSRADVSPKERHGFTSRIRSSRRGLVSVPLLLLSELQALADELCGNDETAAGENETLVESLDASVSSDGLSYARDVGD